MDRQLVDRAIWESYKIDTNLLVVTSINDIPITSNGKTRVYHNTHMGYVDSILENGILPGALTGNKEALSFVMASIDASFSQGVFIVADIDSDDVHMVNDSWLQVHRSIDVSEVIAIYINNLSTNDIDLLISIYKS